jgi:YVTN family beta-propeller protein
LLGSSGWDRIGPYGIAAGAEDVWVANGLDGTVVRIEPTTAKVSRKITLGYSPRGVALGDGSVWVTIQAPS